MTLRQFYDWQTHQGGEDVSKLVTVLEQDCADWCMIEDFAVNYWASEPLITQKVDFVVTSSQAKLMHHALTTAGFSQTISPTDSHFLGNSLVNFRCQKNKSFMGYPARAVIGEVFEITMKVANLQDTLEAKVLSFREAQKRSLKTQKFKDLTDIARLLEAHPQILKLIPAEIYDKLEK